MNSTTNILITKFNETGDLNWLTNLAGDEGSGLIVRITPDKGYIILTNPPYQHCCILLIKFSENNNLMWTKRIETLNAQSAAALQLTADGGYLIAGDYIVSTETGYEVFLAKFTENGQLLWSKSFGSKGDDHATALHETNDNGYIIVSYNTMKIQLTKLTQVGDLIWSKAVNFSGFSTDLQLTLDGGYIITGFIQNPQRYNQWEVLIAKFSENGDLNWAKMMNGLGSTDSRGRVLKVTADGDYMVLGSFYGWLGKTAFLSKFTAEGDLTWTSTINKNLANPYSMVFELTPDNNQYVLLGTSWQFSMLARFNKDGSIDDCPLCLAVTTSLTPFSGSTIPVNISFNSLSITQTDWPLQIINQAPQPTITLCPNSSTTTSTTLSTTSSITTGLPTTSTTSSLTTTGITTTGTTGSVTTEQITTINPSGTSSNTETNQNSSQVGSEHTGAIIGGIAGGVAGLLVCGGIGFFAYRNYQRKQQKTRQIELMVTETTPLLERAYGKSYSQ